MGEGSASDSPTVPPAAPAQAPHSLHGQKGDFPLSASQFRIPIPQLQPPHYEKRPPSTGRPFSFPPNPSHLHVTPTPTPIRIRLPHPHQHRHVTPTPQPMPRKRPTLLHLPIVDRTPPTNLHPLPRPPPPNHPLPQHPHHPHHLPQRHPLHLHHLNPLLQHRSHTCSTWNIPQHFAILKSPRMQGNRVEMGEINKNRAPTPWTPKAPLRLQRRSA